MSAGGSGADLADSLMRRLEALRDDKPRNAPKTADELAAQADALFYGNSGSTAESYGLHGADGLEARLASLAGEAHPAKQAIAAARASLRLGAADYGERLMLLQLAESMEASGDHAAALSALRAGEFAVPVPACAAVFSSPDRPSGVPASGRASVDSEIVERLAAEGAAAAARDCATFGQGKLPWPSSLVPAGATQIATGCAITKRSCVAHGTLPSGASSDDDSDSSLSSNGSSSEHSSEHSSGRGCRAAAQGALDPSRHHATSAEEACAAASRLLQQARRNQQM